MEKNCFMDGRKQWCKRYKSVDIKLFLNLDTKFNYTLSRVGNKFQLMTEDGLFYKFMYSKNFHDFDSEQYHRVLLQEKLNGAYVV